MDIQQSSASALYSHQPNLQFRYEGGLILTESGITMKLVSLIKTCLMKPMAESRAKAHTP